MNLDTYIVRKKPRNTKKWTLGMDKSDELSILNGEWITDSIIIAGQNLIQECYPHITGFQCPALGFTLSYKVMNSEFVQIIHNGANHWVTISTVGCADGFVDIYDSLIPHLNHTLRQQIASLIFCQKKEITVK